AEERKKEIGVIRTLGATRKKTTVSFTFEGSLLSIIASAIGVVLGIVLAIACVWLTNTFWTNIVEGNEIALHLTATSIVVGLVSGFLIALITYAIASYSISRMRIVEALRRISLKLSKKSRGLLPILAIILGALIVSIGFIEDIGSTAIGASWLFGPVLILLGAGFLVRAKTETRWGCGIAGLASIIYVIAFDIAFLSTYNEPAFLLFFLSGFMVVLGASVALWSGMGAIARWFGRTSVTKVAFTNPTRRAGQSAMTMAMFAEVVFTLVALSVNVAGQEANLDQAISEQGAGYQVLAEATTPLRFDLGDAQARMENGLPEFPGGYVTVQFPTYGNPGGTCSNLNSVLPPRLIGSNETFVLDNTLRFSSAQYHESSDPAGAWSELYETPTDGSIPVIGDANTIIWIYGKGIGDTIEVKDENGVPRKLLVTGILQSSIFTGSVFLSEDNLDDLYPTKAEYDLFLFRTSQPNQLIPYLEQNLTAYGIDAVLVEERVRENLEIEWSYMSLFQVLLVFGLIVGTAGLALTSAKSVSERRNEIGVLRSLGFKRNMVLSSFLLENLYISLSGTLIGVVFGLLISLVFFGPVGGQGYGVVIPWLTIAVIVIIVLVATILATAGPSLRAGRLETVEALKTEE
ncbi:MAG: FtsX-like permease family protein, partial [Methanobacteriota archaeon]